MGKKSKSKLYWNICMTASIIVAVIVAGYFGLYRYWKLNVDQENGYNSIDSLIGAIGIPINILTIIFVAITYRQQSKQIKEQREQLKKNDKDIEYNRGLDLIYRQLGHTQEKVNKLLDESGVRKIAPLNTIDAKFPYIPKIHFIFHTVFNDLLIIDSYLDNADIDKDKKDMLFGVFLNNLDNDFKGLISGTVNSIVEDNLNPTNSSQKRYENYVKSVYINKNVALFTDPSGAINTAKLDEVLKSNQSNISNSAYIFELTLNITRDIQELTEKYNVKRI